MKRVAVTTTADAAPRAAEPLIAHGLTPVMLPCIAISPVKPATAASIATVPAAGRMRPSAQMIAAGIPGRIADSISVRKRRSTRSASCATKNSALLRRTS